MSTPVKENVSSFAGVETSIEAAADSESVLTRDRKFDVLIFKAAIHDAWDPSYKTIADLLLVCRYWKEAGTDLKLFKVPIASSKQMDALLGYVQTTALFRESGCAPVQLLSVETEYQKDFHRLSELLALCRRFLQYLHLSRFFTSAPIAELLQDARPEAESDLYFPKLAALCLSKFTPRELISFITSVNPLTLEHLELRDTFLRFDHILSDELTTLCFPRLREVVVDGYARAENPTIGWLCQIAPNLEMLELSIVRERLPVLTEFLASDRIPKTLQRPRVWVKINRYDHIGLESPDLAPLLQLIKERGWIQWICVHTSCGSWVYE
ncbi:hypothetical protein M407DRAFT_30522 [Tulasnella calospora MUT 4182]|uniref:F-box domain-containing protein n=1 Tax=Tulasnella calospora MUT 4182 TaxID=1051891 RepID=A0A0C3Q814_9AGAM|nr:hypothetical protein M407DRAFT_30522 [Tulasnella calospora MUT 4182]